MSTSRRFVAFIGLALIVSLVSLQVSFAQKPNAPAKTYQQVVDSAVLFLRTKAQADDGSFSKQSGPAVTALVLAGAMKNGLPAKDPMISKGIDYLKGFAQPDGGIYASGSKYVNYETCLSIIAFNEALASGGDPALKEIVAKAEKFVRDLQWDEGESHGKESFAYGGAGYGNSKRPDLSNTSFLMDALVSCGAGEDDPNIQKALIFVSRCQNLESEHNTTPFAAIVQDGGFYYTPAAGGASQAQPTPDMPKGALRSYASMSYAGLKSMIYAGLEKDDPRVQACVEWLKKNYDLKSNPGMGDSGLFYYYNTFGKALAAFGEPMFTDESGAEHAWKDELLAELASRQHEDGSWTNANSRWLEGDANLVTGYSLMALSFCKDAK